MGFSLIKATKQVLDKIEVENKTLAQITSPIDLGLLFLGVRKS
jgi:hypothetical protein